MISDAQAANLRPDEKDLLVRHAVGSVTLDMRSPDWKAQTSLMRMHLIQMEGLTHGKPRATRLTPDGQRATCYLLAIAADQLVAAGLIEVEQFALTIQPVAGETAFHVMRREINERHAAERMRPKTSRPARSLITIR